MDWHWCVGLIIWRVQHLLSVHSACRVWIYNLSIFGANLIQNIENEKKKEWRGVVREVVLELPPPSLGTLGKVTKKGQLEMRKTNSVLDRGVRFNKRFYVIKRWSFNKRFEILCDTGFHQIFYYYLIKLLFHERVIACTVFTWKFKQDISHVEISVGATITALETKSSIENCLILSTLQIFVKTFILDENLSLDACWFFFSSKQCLEIGCVSGREKWFTARDNIEECSSASVICKVMQIFSSWMLYGFL